MYIFIYICIYKLNTNAHIKHQCKDAGTKFKKSHDRTELRSQVACFTDRAEVMGQVTIKMNLIMVKGEGKSNGTRSAPRSIMCYVC